MIVKVLDDMRVIGDIWLPECSKGLYRCYVVDVGDGVRDVDVGDIVYLSFYPMNRVEVDGIEYCVVYGGDILLKEESSSILEVIKGEHKELG